MKSENTGSRIALLAIVVTDNKETEDLNRILHEYADFIIGRMGIPYRKAGINLISIAVDAPHEEITAMTKKIGELKGVTAKAAMAQE